MKNGKGYTRRANRLVAEAYIHNPENKPTVNHIDGNKQNNYYKNLELATLNEQMSHAYKIGLKKPMRTNCLLTDDQVREIRKTYKSHSKEFSMKALAKRYNVSEPTIDKCVHYRTYKDAK